MRLLVLLLALGAVGCSPMIARQMVTAPNQNPLFAPHFSEDEPNEARRNCVDQSLRLPVGPPGAEISIWVCEPSLAMDDFSLSGPVKRMAVKLTRQPATQPAPAPRGTVFILHGILDDKTVAPYVIYREMLVHSGYRVVQVDLRGHGRSGGKYITYGAVEAFDMKQCLDQLIEQHRIAGRVGVMGISYGAAVAIQWAAIDPRVSAVVAIEPFTSLRDIAHDGSGFILGPAKWLFSPEEINRTVDRVGQLAGFDPALASPLAAIGMCAAPILLIHSRDDEFIPWQHSQRLHDAAPEHSKLILVGHNSHFDIWLKSMELIRDNMLFWFEQHLVLKKFAEK